MYVRSHSMLPVLASSILYVATAPAASVAPDAELWRPGCVNTAAQETSLALHPGQERAWFMRGDFSSTRATLLEIRLAPTQRCALRIASFSGQWRDSEPHVSPDGERLYFVSNRPITPGGPPVIAEWNGRRFPGAQLWFVHLDPHGRAQGQPQRVAGAANEVPMVYSPSTTAAGELYFSSHRPDSGPGYQIYRTAPDSRTGAHGAIARVDLGSVERSRMDPAISADGRLLVYAGDEGNSLGAADLYLSVRQPDGRWGPPQHLPAPVNSPWLENAPAWGPEPGVLFVTSARPATTDPEARPEPVGTVSALDQSLMGAPLNGSRNLWRIDLRAWLSAQGLDQTAEAPPH